MYKVKCLFNSWILSIFLNCLSRFVERQETKIFFLAVLLIGVRITILNSPKMNECNKKREKERGGEGRKKGCNFYVELHLNDMHCLYTEFDLLQICSNFPENWGFALNGKKTVERSKFIDLMCVCVCVCKCLCVCCGCVCVRIKMNKYFCTIH